MRNTQYFANLRAVRRITATIVEVVEGEGTVESPVRVVKYIVDDDGAIVTVVDPQGVIYEPGQPLKDVPS